MTSNVNARIARAGCGDERLGRVDRGHGRGREPPDQLRGECARATADVEHPLAATDPGQGRKLRGEQG